MPDRIDLIRLKIERAKEHIRNLETEVRAFLTTKPYRVGTKHKPETGQLVYYLVDVKPVPLRIAVMAGDALQNLRSALDHLAWQLVLANGRNPMSRTAFPIYDDLAKYKSESLRQVQGMSNAAIKAIDAVKPYKGGNDTLWRLHRLNNVDKHRFVITAGLAFRSINLGAHVFATLAAQNSAFANMETIHAFFKTADRMFPLKAGDELFIDAPDGKVNEKMQFRFDVAFGE